MNLAIKTFGVLLEVASIGLAVALWRGRERVVSKVLWTLVLLVPFGWEKTLQFDLIALGTARAAVRVTFRNGQPQDIHYTLVRERARWLIDDAKSVAGERWVLSEILEGGR